MDRVTSMFYLKFFFEMCCQSGCCWLAHYRILPSRFGQSNRVPLQPPWIDLSRSLVSHQLKNHEIYSLLPTGMNLKTRTNLIEWVYAYFRGAVASVGSSIFCGLKPKIDKTRPIAISRVLRVFSDGQTDRQTDRPTYRQTDRQSGL